MLPELVEHDRGQQVCAEEATRRHMKGAGEWLIDSQSRQVNFSRTVSITLKRLGISSSVSVTSSPQLRQPLTAATGAARRSVNENALTLDILRPGLAGEGTHGRLALVTAASASTNRHLPGPK
jgi:hypothetical protein